MTSILEIELSTVSLSLAKLGCTLHTNTKAVMAYLLSEDVDIMTLQGWEKSMPTNWWTSVGAKLRKTTAGDFA